MSRAAGFVRTSRPDIVRTSAALLLLLAALAAVEATHFRYGSISWYPGSQTLAGDYEAVFELKMAFRRDYFWGAYFKEQWREAAAAGVPWKKTTNGMPGPSFSCGTPGVYQDEIHCFTDTGTDYTAGYQIKFPVSMSARGLDLVPNLDAQNYYTSTGVVNANADPENLGGRMCASPLNKGVLGNPDATVITHNDDENFPQYSIGNVLPLSPGDPNLINICTPWAEANGFFFGDSASSSYTSGVVLNIEEVNYEFSMLGNSIRGTSDPIKHTYPAPSNGGQPYIAFMTGGNRLSTLNNNADGRFRLEVEVLFNMELDANGRRLFLKNRSPIASTMAIMPVVYKDSFTGSDGAVFQIAAFDPDFGDPDLADQVRFFIGDQNEFGGILGNPVYVPLPDNTTSQVLTWYEDNYHSFICQQRLAISSIVTFNPLDEICTSQIYVGREQSQVYSNPLDPYTPRADVPIAELYRAWNDAKNLPHAPPDLTLDPFSGFVTFRTGKDPWTAATDGASAKDPGLWQLTVSVEERHGDTIDPVSGYDVLADGTTQYPTKGNGMKVPLDFLIYLYTPMHYCSKGCNNGVGGSAYPDILQTFESATGRYGDAASALVSRADGLQGPGTGECRLCGGGGKLVPFYTVGQKVEYYEESVKNAPMFCRVPTSVAYGTVEANLLRNGTIGTTGSTFGSTGAQLNDAGLPFSWKTMSDGSIPGWRYLPYHDSGLTTNYCSSARSYTGPTTQNTALVWQGWVFQGCLGYRDNTTNVILPYDGELDSCLLNIKPEFITACTTDHPIGDCAVLNSTTTPLRTTPALGCEFRMQNGALIPQDATLSCCSSNFPLSAVTATNMNATQGVYEGMYAPAVVNGVKGETVTFDLVATDYDQCVELEILDTGLYDGMSLSPHERIDTRSVLRTFTWDPIGSDGNPVMEAEKDARDDISLVCFYAFDKYLATANPFHCVRILLAMPASIRWCDQPLGTVSANPITVDGATLSAYLGEETCVDLCVAKRDEATTYVQTSYNLALRTVEHEVAGLYPSPQKFIYPYDQINFPPSGDWKDGTGSDPFQRQWCLTPTASEECVYTVCFQGYDVDTVVDGDYFDEELQTTNVRCVKIEVYNTVAQFSGNEILEADELSAQVLPFGEDAHLVGAMGGFTMGAWVWPACLYSNANQTLMYFGSTRSYGGTLAGGDAGIEVRNGLSFHHIPGSDALGYFSYNDCKIGHVYSSQQYCCQCWHYVTVSISQAGEGTLYVDGTQSGHARAHGRDALMFDAVEFKTSSFPDNNLDGDNSGIFSVGGLRGVTTQGYQGLMDEVRVWNRHMSNAEVLETIYLRAPDPTDATLKAHFHMRNAPAVVANPATTPVPPLEDGSGTLANGLVSLTGAIPTFLDMPIPPMVPCVLGIQHSVGPVDGECLTDVYGWSMADSNNVVCKFGGQDSPGKWVNTGRVRCVTPGHMSPRFAEVHVSNDGYRFTNTTGAAKTVNHLFMESSLYTDGAGEGGVSADGVCLDLPSREMTFGGWFCPKCTIPVDPEAPPPPPPPAQPAPEPPTPTPTPAPVEGGK